MGLITCSDCERQVSDRAVACPNCGAPIAGDKQSIQKAPETVEVTLPKSRLIAILLALFLGAFGFHRFYMNQPKWGTLYLIFFWTLIPWFFALFDMLHYMTTNEEEFKAIYTPKK